MIMLPNNSQGLLCKNVRARLGCSKTGTEDIKAHKFFEGLDWVLLEARAMVPPFKPKVKSSRDVGNFDIEFTSERVGHTPTDEAVLAAIDQSEFEGFSFVNEAFGKPMKRASLYTTEVQPGLDSFI